MLARAATALGPCPCPPTKAQVRQRGSIWRTRTRSSPSWTTSSSVLPPAVNVCLGAIECQTRRRQDVRAWLQQALSRPEPVRHRAGAGTPAVTRHRIDQGPSVHPDAALSLYDVLPPGARRHESAPGRTPGGSPSRPRLSARAKRQHPGCLLAELDLEPRGDLGEHRPRVRPLPGTAAAGPSGLVSPVTPDHPVTPPPLTFRGCLPAIQQLRVDREVAQGNRAGRRHQ